MTGHRSEALAGAEGAVLRTQVRNVLEAIQQHAASQRVVVISPLAAGADQIVAEEALALGWELHAPLPFPHQVYAEDFDELTKMRFRSLLERASAVIELPGTRATPATARAAYAAVGNQVVNDSDLLLAIWDGDDGRGEGGTFDVITMARERNIPIIWISSWPPHAVRQLMDGKEIESIGELVAEISK